MNCIKKLIVIYTIIILSCLLTFTCHYSNAFERPKPGSGDLIYNFKLKNKIPDEYLAIIAKNRFIIYIPTVTLTSKYVTNEKLLNEFIFNHSENIRNKNLEHNFFNINIFKRYNFLFLDLIEKEELSIFDINSNIFLESINVRYGAFSTHGRIQYFPEHQKHHLSEFHSFFWYEVPD